MNRDVVKLINELLDGLKSRLINELAYARCPVCGNMVYHPGDGIIIETGWKNGHMPYYNLEGGRIRAGYRCPKSEKPIIVYDISLKDVIAEWKETATKYLE